MHRLLRRQLKKHLGIEDEVPRRCSRSSRRSAPHADFDSDRAMLERSLELSSKGWRTLTERRCKSGGG